MPLLSPKPWGHRAEQVKKDREEPTGGNLGVRIEAAVRQEPLENHPVRYGLVDGAASGPYLGRC